MVTLSLLCLGGLQLPGGGGDITGQCSSLAPPCTEEWAATVLTTTETEALHVYISDYLNI